MKPPRTWLAWWNFGKEEVERLVGEEASSCSLRNIIVVLVVKIAVVVYGTTGALVGVTV